jgi:hypothetical protein
MPKAKQIPSRETLATVAKQLLQLCKGDAALAASKIAEANESGIDQFKEAIRPTPEEIFCAMTGTPPTRAEAALPCCSSEKQEAMRITLQKLSPFTT